MTGNEFAVGLINFIRQIAWHGEPTALSLDVDNLRWEKVKMAKNIVIGSDYIGQFNAIVPIKLSDPASSDIHVPGDPTASSSDDAVAKAAVYNMMLMIRFEGVGECDVTVTDALASGNTLTDVVHVIVQQDPIPTEISIDTENVTFEPANTPH
jgi:hypothetical protein